MTVVDRSNPLAGMLANAFNRFDQDQDGKLGASEFRSFYELLKAGIAVDEKGRPTVSEQDYRARMDTDGDGCVAMTEVQSTGVLMPADLTDVSLDSMIQYLLGQSSESARAAAGLLTQPPEQAQDPSVPEVPHLQELQAAS